VSQHVSFAEPVICVGRCAGRPRFASAGGPAPTFGPGRACPRCCPPCYPACIDVAILSRRPARPVKRTAAAPSAPGINRAAGNGCWCRDYAACAPRALFLAPCLPCANRVAGGPLCRWTSLAADIPPRAGANRISPGPDCTRLLTAPPGARPPSADCANPGSHLLTRNARNRLHVQIDGF